MMGKLVIMFKVLFRVAFFGTETKCLKQGYTALHFTSIETYQTCPTPAAEKEALRSTKMKQ